MSGLISLNISFPGNEVNGVLVKGSRLYLIVDPIYFRQYLKVGQWLWYSYVLGGNTNFSFCHEIICLYLSKYFRR